MTSSSTHLTEQPLQQDQNITESPRVQNSIIELPLYNPQNRCEQPKTNLFKYNREPILGIKIGKKYKKSPIIQPKKIRRNNREILPIRKKSVLKREFRNGSNCQNQFDNSLNQIQNRGQNSTLQSSPEGNDSFFGQTFEPTPVTTQGKGPSRVNSRLHQFMIENASLKRSLFHQTLQNNEQNRTVQEDNLSQKSLQGEQSNTERLSSQHDLHDRQDQGFLQDSQEENSEDSHDDYDGEDQPHQTGSENQDTQDHERQTVPFPQLPIRDFIMKIQSHKYISQGFEPAGSQKYSIFYEKIHLKKETTFYRTKIKYDQKKGLKILCLNCDYNVHSRQDKKTKKLYHNKITEQERATQLMNIIWQAMKEEVDFIVLQQVYIDTMRQELFVALQCWNHVEYIKYFYPNNLAKFQEYRGTIILTRHQVKTGQLRFDIQESENQKKWRSRFPTQAFCEFDIYINGKWEKVCILSCHLRSNGATFSNTRPRDMRQRQIKCLQDFSKRFDRFYCIGDTNIPSSQFFKEQNTWVSTVFTDAVKSNHTTERGTFLYLRKSKKVVLERNDRVWMKHQNFERTNVKIEYRDELLNSCKGLNLDPKQMLKIQDGKLTYISPTDHTILDITLSFN